jgi:hypothetical protein
MLLFTAEDHDRVARGDVTVTWRLWKYPHVKAGGVYATGFGFVAIEDVRPVKAREVSDSDAQSAGLGTAADLLELARSHTGATLTPDTTLYRVQFRFLGRDDPRPQRPLPDIEQVIARLGKLDRGTRGPWSLQTLRLIEENPRVVARKLAAQLDWDTVDFKVHVRKLKALGLTISCEVGYELSEFGQTYLDTRASDEATGDLRDPCE